MLHFTRGPALPGCGHFLLGSYKDFSEGAFLRVELRIAGLAAGDTGLTSLWLTPDDGGEEQEAEVGFPGSAGKSLSFMAQQQETNLPCIPEDTAVSCASMSVWEPLPPSWHGARRQQRLRDWGPAVSFGSWRARGGAELSVPGSFHASFPALDPSREVAHREGPDCNLREQRHSPVTCYLCWAS